VTGRTSWEGQTRGTLVFFTAYALVYT
jgi:hypothetical protein